MCNIAALTNTGKFIKQDLYELYVRARDLDTYATCVEVFPTPRISLGASFRGPPLHHFSLKRESAEY